jgi:hypothetical protein
LRDKDLEMHKHLDDNTKWLESQIKEKEKLVHEMKNLIDGENEFVRSANDVDISILVRPQFQAMKE